MKNITRRGFLQLTAATALVCAAAPLTGCGKKNKKELIIGTWYRQGSDDLAFTIYDDGKYSLQGTTQGNGLTGGVPPVRFSM